MQFGNWTIRKVKNVEVGNIVCTRISSFKFKVFKIECDAPVPGRVNLHSDEATHNFFGDALIYVFTGSMDSLIYE